MILVPQSLQKWFQFLEALWRTLHTCESLKFPNGRLLAQIFQSWHGNNKAPWSLVKHLTNFSLYYIHVIIKFKNI